MSLNDRNVLIEMAGKLICAPKVELFASADWSMQVPSVPGVYALWDRVSGSAVYVGETADLRARMRDLGRFRNHTCRRKLAASFGMSGEDEKALSEAIARTHLLSYIEVSMGRTELEEYLSVRWGETLINSPGLRHLTRYSWVEKESRPETKKGGSNKH